MKEEVNPDLRRFAEDVHRYRGLMQEAFQRVIGEGVSKYPVFVFHQKDVEVGLPIVDRHTTAGNWSVHISTLEEFYIKGIIVVGQIEEIKAKITGDPPQYCCLVVGNDQTHLVFLKSE